MNPGIFVMLGAVPILYFAMRARAPFPPLRYPSHRQSGFPNR